MSSAKPKQIDNIVISAGFRARFASLAADYTAAGSKHLDKVAPDWYTKIDLESFDMSDAFHWVCAQVAGKEFGDAAISLCIYARRGGPGAASGGFVVTTVPYYQSRVHDMTFYALLQEYWVQEIEKRTLVSSCKHDPKQVNQTEEI